MRNAYDEQGKQVLKEIAPIVSLYIPLGHGWHVELEEAMVEEDQVPAQQGVQLDEFELTL